ncbi:MULTISPECIES: sensor histidine kinase [Sphingobacterium]|uniref:sensor histidine kinase n=2 Tax=Sphingobacteriaceae TaxID=84566 RepID=UPI0015FB6EFE|nr:MULTISPECIES: HAMP domain-containing sensor histidine kinase [Sphingobacterium]MBA8985762.1 nitrogen fixation/metabolism regulation signal transduction histidine kinase [Sphingobacterium soli]WFB64173.1 HAMP domain-containing sensor histidine kinase [Sphingobacterium sp. WM]
MNRLAITDFFKMLLLIVLAIGIAFLIFKGFYLYAGLGFFFLLIISFRMFSRHRFLLKQMVEFSEAVKYRDFTRRFVVKSEKTAEGKLYSAFNQINDVYKNISIDQALQHQYLNKVINMLDTAIIFYDADSGKVIWLNDAFKDLFQVPHLGNISGMEKRHPELYQKTMQLKVGKHQMETAHSSKGKIKLLMQSSGFETQDGSFRIIVYQNINEAIDETETRAWHKLLRVLTHEIMNSIGPISSLAETLHDRLEHWEGEQEIDDLKLGIFTIKRRSEGLLQFAKSYRLINKVDQPQFSEILVIQLFENIYQLLEPTLIQKNIDVDIIIKNTRMILRADLNLLEQVIINLLLNAIEAVKEVEEPYISLSAIETRDIIQLKIQDNGGGMSPEIQEQIFTPFFTTKKTGTGVGLTLSKQIMLMHGGNISVDSKEGEGSTFTLQF